MWTFGFVFMGFLGSGHIVRYEKEKKGEKIMEETVKIITVNDTTEIHIRKSEFQGNLYIDVRKFFVPDTGEPQPTKKGLSLSPGQWEELIPEIQEVLG